MLRIAICDDETEARDALRICLEKIIEEETEEIVYEFTSGERSVSWLQKHPGEIDVLFLDVEMKGMNGMETAQQIRLFDKNLLIVFVTGYADYVFDGYQVGALDYLMKPVQVERLKTVCARIRQNLEKQADKTLLLKNVDGIYRFAFDDILYVYSERRLVHLVTRNREYLFYKKLDELESQLDASFVRIHQRYLVHAKAVSKITGGAVEIEKKDGITTLPISRALKEEATAKLVRAMLEE